MPQPFRIGPFAAHHTELSAALFLLLDHAQHFYQHTAELAWPSELRRQFNALALLHQQVLHALPPAKSRAKTNLPDLAELCYWYGHHHNRQPDRRSLRWINRQLEQQLRLQKTMIRTADLRQHQMPLLHFTVSLQVAADRLRQAQLVN